jgi:hypothetical protein
MAELVDKFISKNHKLEKELLNLKNILSTILERIIEKEDISS